MPFYLLNMRRKYFFKIAGGSKKEKNLINALVIFTLLALGILYHYRYINEFPSHIHARAQSDRYALSLGFLENGLNFFKPQTFVLNHEFPHRWEVPAEKSITAVDFPIHDYITALLMKITGSTSPWVFRLYVYLYSLFGLFFLFRLAFALTDDYIKSVLVLLFAATSPVFVYYQGGFLPSIPSLSNAYIGLYFYFIFIRDNRNRNFVLSMLFLTLAALSRLTFVIPLLAVLCTEFIRLLKRESGFLPKIIPVSVSLLVLILYQLYNGYLRETYGSLFLNSLLPPKNILQAGEIIKYATNKWGLQYFTLLHYLIFAGSFIAALSFFIFRKAVMRKHHLSYGLFLIACFTGCLIFSFFMLQQFSEHDYYFIDTFFLPLVILFTCLLSLLPPLKRRILKTISLILLCFISAGLILPPIKSQEFRRKTGSWDLSEATINNFQGSSVFLDSLGISNDSRLLVINAIEPNIAFILMQRKGFAFIYPNQSVIEKALTWDYDYIIIQNENFVSNVYNFFPEVLSKLNKTADNGKISVCTHPEVENPQDLAAFFGLKNKTPVFEKIFITNYKPDSLSKYPELIKDSVSSGDFAGHITPDIMYSKFCKTTDLPVLKSGSSTLLFTCSLLSKTLTGCEIVISLKDNDKVTYYKAHYLKDILRKQNSWEDIALLCLLPKVESNKYEFALFFSNSGRTELYVDDVSLTIY